MRVEQTLKTLVGEKWIPTLYSEKIRVLRTRAYSLGIPAKENDAEILHTLLGIELKVGKKRLSCPDLSTARYLRVFARLGVSDVAVPYDISKIAAFADEFESAWRFTLLLLKENDAVKGKARSAVIKLMRLEISESGAGEAMPEFNRATKQEKYHQKNK